MDDFQSSGTNDVCLLPYLKAATETEADVFLGELFEIVLIPRPNRPTQQREYLRRPRQMRL